MPIEPMVVPVDDARAASALRLLVRFFAEEDFAGDATSIASRFEMLRRDPHHWAALALDQDRNPSAS
jgi:hypothetical protein